MKVQKYQATGDSRTLPIIGVLLNNYYHAYTIGIWDGIKKAVDETGCHLINFVGGNFNNPYHQNTQNTYIYNLARTEKVDGILLYSTTLTNYITRQEYYTFLQGFQSIPMVSIGVPFPDYHSIFIDNKTGMHDLVTHLITVHGCKRIAFICGPKNSIDSNDRYNTYREVLSKHGLFFDPDLVTSGPFYAYVGRDSVVTLLDERKVQFDALICSNDFVALHAIDELERRGIRVPQDMIVTGFDDVPQNQFDEQPLTTVRQPLFTLGYEATKMMLSVIEKETEPVQKSLKSELVIRGTCGCNLQPAGSRGKHREEHRDILPEEMTGLLVEKMREEFNDQLIVSFFRPYAEKILQALAGDLGGAPGGSYAGILEECLRESLQYKINFLSWNNILFYLFEELVPAMDTAGDGNTINTMLIVSFKIVHNVMMNNHVYSLAKIDDQMIQLIVIKKMLVDTFEIRTLKRIINDNFFDLGITGCYIAVFSGFKKNKPADKSHARILVAFKDCTLLGQEEEEKIVKPEDLVPDIIRSKSKDSSCFVYTLGTKNELLGFVVFEIENRTLQRFVFLRTSLYNIYESLTMELGNTVKSILIYNELQQQTQKISTNSPVEHSDTCNYYTLPDTVAEKYFRKLLDLMEDEKPYINPKLTLSQLAARLDIKRNNLSYVINTYCRVNFYDFINNYRIERAKQYLTGTGGKEMDILEIAYDSGFNAKSTFYRTFKEYTGMTPVEYRKACRNRGGAKR